VGEVNEIEGFFCNIRYVGPSDHTLTPRRAGITVSAKGYSGSGTRWRGGAKQLLYQ